MMKRAFLLICAALIALGAVSANACIGVHKAGETAAPVSPDATDGMKTDAPATDAINTDAPESGEPDIKTPETDAPEVVLPDDGNLRWGSDLDGDGTEEYFVFNPDEYLEGSTIPWIEKSGEKLGDLEEISSAHVSLNTYAFTVVDGKNYVLEYCPYSGSGINDLHFILWGIEDGQLKAVENGSAEVFYSPGQPAEYNDVDAVIAYVERANEVLKSSRLIVSSDWYCVLKNGGLYDTATGSKAEYSIINALISTADLDSKVDTEKYAEKLTFVDAALSYKEMFSYLDVSATEGMDIREKLEYSNYLIAEDRAWLLAAQELGLSDIDGFEVISRERTENGGRFVVFFPAKLFEGENAEDKFVTVENDKIVEVSNTNPMGN